MKERDSVSRAEELGAVACSLKYFQSAVKNFFFFFGCSVPRPPHANYNSRGAPGPQSISRPPAARKGRTRTTPVALRLQKLGGAP